MLEAVSQREKIVETMTEEERSELVQRILDMLNEEECRKSVSSIEKVLR